MSTHHARRAALILALCTLAANCSFGHRRNAAGDGLTNNGNAIVVVRNHNFNDMSIYVIGTGDRMRIGTVTGESTATFSIPAWTISSGHLSLVGDPIGGTVLAYSGNLSVSPGSVVTFTIEQNVALSAAEVR